jgi:hypothetical protein
MEKWLRMFQMRSYALLQGQHPLFPSKHPLQPHRFSNVRHTVSQSKIPVIEGVLHRVFCIDKQKRDIIDGIEPQLGTSTKNMLVFQTQSDEGNGK